MTSLETLVNALRAGDAGLRQQAALRLGAIDTSEVMDELVPLMAAEPDDFVRETLTWALVARPGAATPELLAALARADLPHEPVLHALSKIGDASTVAAITPHAASDDTLVAAKAWWALGRIATPEALTVLLEHLGTTDPERRRVLTRALLQVGEPAIDALSGELGSDDPARRSHAAEVVVAFADQDRYGTAERRDGRDHSEKAAAILREATAGEVDNALLIASADERPGLAAAAERLRGQRG